MSNALPWDLTREMDFPRTVRAFQRWVDSETEWRRAFCRPAPRLAYRQPGEFLVPLAQR